MQVPQKEHRCWDCDPKKMGGMLLCAKSHAQIIVHLGAIEPDKQQVALSARKQQRGEFPRARDRHLSEEYITITSMLDGSVAAFKANTGTTAAHTITPPSKHARAGKQINPKP